MNKLIRYLTGLTQATKDMLYAVGLTIVGGLPVLSVNHFLTSRAAEGIGRTAAGVATLRDPGIIAMTSVGTHVKPDVMMGSTASIYWAPVVIACAFLPLIWRRRAPWTTFFLSLIAAMAYTLHPWPPTIIFLAPMIGIYTVAGANEKNRVHLISVIIGALILCVLALTYSRERWAVELVGITGILTAAALLGDTRRSTKAYIQAVEQRALEAERTKDEEALRRVESERVHIARDVHDIVAHSLSIVAVQAAAADALIESDPERARESLHNIRTTAKGALTELRSMIGLLRGQDDSAPLRPVSDISAIPEIVANAENAGLTVEYAHSIDIQIPSSISVSAFRIVQEALTNVLRHSDADTVTIRLSNDKRALSVRINDNGKRPPSNDTSGHGLEGMRERCDALGGTCTAGWALDGTSGFTISALIPFERESV